jgi:hypothetical protein
MATQEQVWAAHVAEVQQARHDIALLQQELRERKAVSELPKPPKPPTFSGDRGSLPVDEWLYQMELRLGSSDGTVAVQYAAAWLEGTAALWWKGVTEAHTAPTTWVAFKDAMVKQFQPLDPVIKARQQLRRTYQTGPVASYVGQLRAIYLRIPDMSESEKLERFKEGLKHPMLVKVVEANAASFEEAARIAERADAVSYSYARSYGSYHHSGPTPMEIDMVQTSRSFKKEGKPKAPNQPRFNISRDEYKRRRANKLCYKCGKEGHTAAICPKGN